MKAICKKCGNEKFIVNRTHSLCDDCNTERLHGMDRMTLERQKYKDRMNKLVEKRSVEMPKKHVISKSKKQEKIDKQYSQVIKQISEEREPICQSCGRCDKPLSNSHIISRKRCKEIGRIDLITDKNNLLLECFGDSSSCHDQWEHRNISACLGHQSFDYKMQFIKENDPLLYNILIRKVNSLV